MNVKGLKKNIHLDGVCVPYLLDLRTNLSSVAKISTHVGNSLELFKIWHVRFRTFACVRYLEICQK